MSLGRQIRRYARELTATLAILALSLGVTFYVLAHQRVRFPWQRTYAVNIEVTSAQAITPGQGQSIDVAGVQVGSIDSVALKDGVAVVRGAIDPSKLPHVYANASALVRPKTGLQDMVVELDPGHPPARPLPDGGTVPVSATEPEIDLDRVLSGLDADTRDYLRILLDSGSNGLHGRAGDLRRLFAATAPTLRLTRRVTAALADRRAKVERLIHDLRVLSGATASRDTQLADLVSASDAALRALDAHDGALRAALGELPATVASARRALAAAKPFAEELAPTLRDLTGPTRRLTPALAAARPLVRQGRGELGDVLDLVRTARPVAADLRPTAADLLTATPSLTSSFRVLRRVADELAYNSGGQPGYLFWLAWFAHNSNSMLSGSDAQGTFWRGQVMVSCSTLADLAKLRGTPLGGLLKLLPCPQPPGGAP